MYGDLCRSFEMFETFNQLKKCAGKLLLLEQVQCPSLHNIKPTVLNLQNVEKS